MSSAYAGRKRTQVAGTGRRPNLGVQTLERLPGSRSSPSEVGSSSTRQVSAFAVENKAARIGERRVNRTAGCPRLKHAAAGLPSPVSMRSSIRPETHPSEHEVRVTIPLGGRSDEGTRAITTVVALLAIASQGVAQAHVIGNHIRPHQLFMGLVDGLPGIVTPVVIKVVCPGPGTAGSDRPSGRRPDRCRRDPDGDRRQPRRVHWPASTGSARSSGRCRRPAVLDLCRCCGATAFTGGIRRRAVPGARGTGRVNFCRCHSIPDVAATAGPAARLREAGGLTANTGPLRHRRPRVVPGRNRRFAVRI